jgi:hypothetical protein
MCDIIVSGLFFSWFLPFWAKTILVFAARPCRDEVDKLVSEYTLTQGADGRADAGRQHDPQKGEDVDKKESDGSINAKLNGKDSKRKEFLEEVIAYPEWRHQQPFTQFFYFDFMRYMYGRFVLFSLSSIWALFLIIAKDLVYDIWHYGFKFIESIRKPYQNSKFVFYQTQNSKI